MENATKALLIAAAVLVAILIISLGLVVYNMASETINSVNFSGQEITAFNDQFIQYQGQRVRGTEVNAMLRTVLSSNMKSRSEGLTAGYKEPKFVEVSGDVELDTTAQSISPTSMADTSRLYTVEVKLHEKTGFVYQISVEEE